MDEEYSAASSVGGGGKKAGVGGKQHNTLPFWGNETSMNLNPLILANIQSSSYFKVHLFKLKTYHEVVDEIYYQVKHMEPWERGSRKTSGQTGMCGGVRGVGAGGIVSTAYCLLYKLYTLRLTRKQVNGLLNHTDSAYIRALGFMYLRYTQPPGDLYDWYEDYLQDEEEIDVKAGGGQVQTIGQMVYQFMTKLDWFSTLFPRIPVPIQKQIEKKIEQYCREQGITVNQLSTGRGAAAAATTATPNTMTASVGTSCDDYDGGRGGGPAHANSRQGGGGGGGSGGYPPANYRNDHDDRDYYAAQASGSSYGRSRGYDDYPPPPPMSSMLPYGSSDRDKDYGGERGTERAERGERGGERSERRRSSKHKKKHKHRQYSRSRSRSPSKSRSSRSDSRGRHRHDRKRDERSSRHRHNDHYDERERERERDRDRDRDRERERERERRYR
ncbi:pre-mRNA-splicing factor 38B isoform X1 [Drosophila sulfurigaster albostrigata]|uniref:pre-mRNA-splicing factor 38B isoform X1 n=3 Tax=Drosophila sulfurigaster albostrigata TaxID=89887 RepID=UPI002D218615|nr:pre-mRNA-splicing factor 38B isoform X1 [Drosophila sulfurigaster albostrigata]